MGSGSSRLGSRPERATRVNRTKRRLASLICGASTSGDCQYKDTRNELVQGSSEGTSFTTTKPQSRALSERSRENSDDGLEDGPRGLESSNGRKCFPESIGSVSTHQVDIENRTCQERLDNMLSSPFREQQYSGNTNHFTHAISGVDNLVGNDIFSHDAEPESGTLSLEREAAEGHGDEGIEGGNSNSLTSPLVSSLRIDTQTLEDNEVHEVVPSGLGFLLSDGAQGQSEGGLVHVDAVSVGSGNMSGNTREISSREARRNDRRMLLDSFPNRSSRRHPDFSTLLFATEDADSLGSQRRWLLDFGNSMSDDGVAENSWQLDRRSSRARERRWRLRSEFLAGHHGASYRGGSRRTGCPLGLHLDGLCSCSLDDEPSPHSSISRIVMLAEALFEVLDELYRQPTPFSVLSHPAPQSVVNSLPHKTYERPDTAESGDDVEQCYICLAEYELGDNIRILPCNHEYHTSCVDKWLKEIHGVCPLCRRDVGQGVSECPIGNSDVSPSLQT